MQIKTLRATAFRNLVDVCCAPGPQINVISGANAQGKTSVIEAIYVALGSPSFRASRYFELVTFDAPKAQVHCEVAISSLCYDILLSIEEQGKTFYVNQKRRTRPQIAGLGTVLFTPDDTHLLKGSPSLRRDLLDNAIDLVWPRFLRLRRSYQRVLRTRNHVLRHRPADWQRLLDAYDASLAHYGHQLIEARLRYVKTLSPHLIEAMTAISHHAETLTISYLGDGEEQLALDDPPTEAALLAMLRSARDRDLERGRTTTGPHVHDLEIFLNGQSVRRFGSQGQLRATILAFKLGQIYNYKEVFGFYPILLLDDVSSELDALRNSELLKIIEDLTCQCFLTTTRPEILPLKGNISEFRMVNGTIGT